MAIRTFKCADTAALFRLQRIARFVNIERPALRKLKLRICFRWRGAGAEDVEIVDYH